MRLSTLLAVLLLFFALAGCGDEEIAQAQLPQEPAWSPKESLVVANCYTVQRAVEDFAAGNNGVYPYDPEVDRNLDGNTVIELLPGGVNLVNPFNGARNQPVGWLATNPGETGYRPIINNGPVDYTVSGFGESDIILILTKDGPVN